MRGKTSLFVLVVCPISVPIKVQKALLRKRSISATAMKSFIDNKESLHGGNYKIIYTSPEILLTDEEW